MDRAPASPVGAPPPLAAPPAAAAAAAEQPAAAEEAGVAAPAAPRRRRAWRWLALALLAYLAWEALTWPDVAWVADHNPKTTAFIERYRSRAARRDLPAPRQRWVSYARISRHLKQAVVVSEDIEFFSHDGFSQREMRAALQDAWEDRELPRGASTISQQVAKNLWLSPSYNPLRKVKEAILTWQLERALSKRRILDLYLNVAEFGPGTYGAEAAARRYFGKSAAALGPAEAAQLAASLPRPSSWHPGVKSRSYQRRVASIQRRMAKARWVLREI